MDAGKARLAVSFRSFKVDVVLCVKNDAETLKPVLKRVISYIPLSRLIVIDGGSDDGTVEIAEEFEAEIYRDGGKGLGYARNMALRLVKTPIFAFIDGDTFIPKHWFSLIRYFKDPKVAVASGFTFFGPEDPVLRALHAYQLRRYRSIPASLSNALLRLDHVKTVGGMREDLPAWEDIDLQRRLIKKGLKWISDRDVVSYQPRDLKKHIAHARWWGRGGRAARNSILETAWFLLKSPVTAIALFFSAHPALLIYYPILHLYSYLGYLDEVKAEGETCG
ncbi:glycosyltransferase [Candidatus Bathyarchaeota archaeon]|nr:glycosyltransferase [Candidatus Bathyarchaeota archaeon]